MIIVYSNKVICPCCKKKITVKAIPRINEVNKERLKEYSDLMEWCYSNTEFSLVKGKNISIYGDNLAT